MRKSFRNVTLACLAILFLFTINILAQAPTTMVYQGRLADANGNPITSEVFVTFTIYLSPNGDAVDLVWTEDIAVVPDEQGVFTAELGITVPLTTDVFNSGVRYLALKVGNDAEMTPRQIISSVPYAINSNIANGAIMNININAGAAISPSKIAGTAATLGLTNSYTGENNFNGTSMAVNADGVNMGDTSPPDPKNVLTVKKTYNSPAEVRGIALEIANSGSGNTFAGRFTANSTGGNSYGIYTFADGANIGSGFTNYAGFFIGNVKVSGWLAADSIHTRASYIGPGNIFKIDHPVDPGDKYLYHSAVESPEMMNVYNGNITTDADGTAIVELPDYFDALNKDFRYQLTVIGDFAQAIVAEEINGNQFKIRTDKPSMKVSWQVTGVRKDAYAKANPIQVEVEKSINEKGLYLHPEAFDLGPEMDINYQKNLEAQKINGGDYE